MARERQAAHELRQSDQEQSNRRFSSMQSLHESLQQATTMSLLVFDQFWVDFGSITTNRIFIPGQDLYVEPVEYILNHLNFFRCAVYKT